MSDCKIDYVAKTIALNNLKDERNRIEEGIKGIVEPLHSVNTEYFIEAVKPLNLRHVDIRAEIKRGLLPLGKIKINYGTENAGVDRDLKFRFEDGNIYGMNQSSEEYYDDFIKKLLNQHQLIRDKIRLEAVRDDYDDFISYLRSIENILLAKEIKWEDENEVEVPVKKRNIYYGKVTHDYEEVECAENVVAIKCEASAKTRYNAASATLILTSENDSKHEIDLYECVIDQLKPEIDELFNRRKEIRETNTKLLSDIHTKVDERLNKWNIVSAV